MGGVSESTGGNISGKAYPERNRKVPIPALYRLWCGFGTSKIHLCKVEAYMRFLYGTYLTPDRRRMEDAFCFVFDDRHLYLVEEGELAGNLLCRLKKIFEQENAGTGSVLTAFLGQLLQKDLLHLEKIEDRLTHLEDEVLSGRIVDFEQKIIGCRKEILKYAHYYLQLQDMADILMKNDYGAFSEEDLRTLRLLREKTGRLHQEAIMLREYSTQVREVYQAQIEIRQNKIMKTLTIVTNDLSAAYADRRLVRYELSLDA